MMIPSSNDIPRLLMNLEKKLGKDVDVACLWDIFLDEEKKHTDFKESVADIVEEYYNDKKDMKGVIEELVTVLSAAREYDNDRESYSEKQRVLIWDTGSETLIKALKILNKN